MTYPSEWQSALTIARDAPLGPAFWRVSGGWGGTQLRPFLVGDLPEFIETEPNSDPERAERITLPVVVNGQIAGERDLDFFVFTAKATEVVVVNVLATRIGSPLDPVVEVTDHKGRRMEVEEVRVGSDPVLAFRVPATGDYRVSIANVNFHGGSQYVYRMTVSTAPFVSFAFPPGAKAGETREVQLFALSGTGVPRAVKERVTFPAVPGPFRLRGTVSLVAGEFAEVIESENNHSATSAMNLTLPVTVNGRFITPTETDWFRFTAKKGESFTITCQPFPETSTALPIVTLLDAAGNSLHKASAADAADHRCEIDWKAPADGTYSLCLRDLQHGTRGGAEFIYRLTIRPARPDFALRLEPDYVNVVQGGRTEMDLTVHRSGGFDGAIDLTATGLPEGVRLEPMRVVAGQSRIKLAVLAKDDTRPLDAMIRLRGKATATGKVLERPIALTPVGMGADEETRVPGVNELHLTVQHKPLFRLTCSEAYQYGHRGTIYPYAMKVERLNGFTGPITIQLCERQVQDLDGIEVVETVVPAGVTDFKNLVYLPENMHVGVQHHCRPYAQGYATFTDKWGQKQTLLAVSEKRCIIRTMPTLARLRAAQQEVTVLAGDMLSVKLILDRTAHFTDAVQLELLDTPGFTAPKVRIDAGASEAVVKVGMAKGMKRPACLAAAVPGNGDASVRVNGSELRDGQGETRGRRMLTGVCPDGSLRERVCHVVEGQVEILIGRKLMHKLLVIALVAVAGVPGVASAAADPADTHPELHLIPWPRKLQVGTGHMRLAADSRIVAGDKQLEPLAGVLSGEIALLTGLKLEVTKGPGRAGDIVLRIDNQIQASEKILVLRGREPVRTTDGAHAIAIDQQAVVTGFDYRATAEGSSTILQLLGRDKGGFRLPQLTIKDWPHADYCGVMLDVARQDHPIDAIKKVVQLCRLYKARYLQLHLTDDQGWTFPSTRYPQLGSKNHAAHGGITPRVYRLKELKDLVAYADARGVTLVPEFEMPGHSGAAARALPEIFDAINPESRTAGAYRLHEHVERGDLSRARRDHRRDVRRVQVVALFSHRQRRGHLRPTVASRRLQGVHDKARPEGRRPTGRPLHPRSLRAGEEARQESDQVGRPGELRDQGRDHHVLGRQQHVRDRGDRSWLHHDHLPVEPGRAVGTVEHVPLQRQPVEERRLGAGGNAGGLGTAAAVAHQQSPPICRGVRNAPGAPDNKVTVAGFAARFQPLDAVAGSCWECPSSRRSMPTFSTSMGTCDFLDPAFALDGNDATFFKSAAIPKRGDHFTVTFKRPQLVHAIEVLTGSQRPGAAERRRGAGFGRRQGVHDGRQARQRRGQGCAEG